MSWFCALPVVATLLAEAPAAVPPADPVVVPIAAGQPVATPPAPAPRAPTGTDGAATRWYGAPAVAADVTEVALFAGVLEYDHHYMQTQHYPGHWHAPGSGRDAAILVLSSLVTGAVVHGLNHHGARAAGSIAWRTFGVLAGLGIGWVIGTSCTGQEGSCSYNGGIAADATLIGLPLAAMAYDDLVLARDTVRDAAATKTSWTPTLRIQSGLALLGVGSAF